MKGHWIIGLAAMFLLLLLDAGGMVCGAMFLEQDQVGCGASS